MENESLPIVYTEDYLYKATVDGETVRTEKTGEIVAEGDMVMCGDENSAFVVKGKYTYKKTGDEITKSFTIDTPEELMYFNRVREYVKAHGKEYHEFILDGCETIFGSRDWDDGNIDNAGDEELGIYFSDTLGYAYGCDPDEEVRNTRRTELKVKKLESEGRIDIRGYANSGNIHFGIECDDEDKLEMKRQRLLNGFDDTETWNLDSTIARFITPRLRRFIETSLTYPADRGEEKWAEDLNAMLWSFENNGYDDKSYNPETMEVMDDDTVGSVYFGLLPDDKRKALTEKHKKGLKLFAENFEYLWW